MTPAQSQTSNAWTADSLFAGEDHTADAHRRAEWSRTPLGPVETWPVELTSAVATVFSSDIAMLLWLGPDLVQVFNDAYRPFLGVKYPEAVGQPAAECWPDVWSEMGPLAEAAFAGTAAKGTEVRLLMDRRGGLPEETYWTFSYSPIRGSDGSVLGVFVATSEVTESVLANRRMAAVQRLGDISTTNDDHPVVTCRAAVSVLETFDADFPLVMAYLDPAAMADVAGDHRLGSKENVVTGESGRTVELVAVGGTLDPDDAHLWLSDGSGVKAVLEVARRGDVVHLHGLSGDGNGRGPLVSEVPLDDLVVLPLRIAGRAEPVGALVVGASPFQKVDELHLSFLNVIASRVSTTLTDVLAYEFQRQRTRALADLDATKTQLLENISHEFRTPLTMLLAPLKDIRDKAVGSDRHSLEVVYRNAVRLRELVDSLLEVVGLSAGSVVPNHEATDIAELTRGCVVQFGSAFGETGLRLDLELGGGGRRDVAMDREKWSRIVTNLVSNAIKYTHDGFVRVALTRQGSTLALEVSDSGIGISEDDRERVFHRFFRVRDARGRSAEGSGIGLALVAELVAALGGTVSVESTLGAGSSFRVVVPVDDAAVSALPPALLPEIAHRVGAATDRGSFNRGVRGGGSRSVLLVEDNHDMADYLVDLMTAQNWDVFVLDNVESALAHARSERPGLVLTDVMLPGGTGLDLVREVRSDPSLVRLPVVVLTARVEAGAAVQALEAGADDYVTKPFEPRELIARIRVHLELSALREEILDASSNETATLHEALHTRSTIGTAIGLVMAAENCDRDAAFEHLTRISQNTNRKARDVAADIVENFAR